MVYEVWQVGLQVENYIQQAIYEKNPDGSRAARVLRNISTNRDCSRRSGCVEKRSTICVGFHSRKGNVTLTTTWNTNQEGQGSTKTWRMVTPSVCARTRTSKCPHLKCLPTSRLQGGMDYALLEAFRKYTSINLPM